MTPEEFANKLKSVPVASPDKMDLAMLKDAAEINDDSAVSIDVYKKEVAAYFEKINSLMPPGMEKLLEKIAAEQGCSLNELP